MKGSFASSPEAFEERCTSFVQLQTWPLLERLNWQGWLSNFTDSDERYFARCLLEAFIYYNNAHADALYLAAFHNLSRTVVAEAATIEAAEQAWETFLRQVVITYVEGEKPSPADSGYSFARRARQLFGVQENRIMGPAEAIKAIVRDPKRPVVFVDDFLGSGQQLEKTWNRDFGLGISFAALARTSQLVAWYIPLLATEYGISRVRPLTSGISIAPAHILGGTYSARDPKSVIWPSGQQQAGQAFVEHVSARAGYGPAECWGFHQLGLAVGIIDTIPDASLPLFYSERNGWRPLMKRR